MSKMSNLALELEDRGYEVSDAGWTQMRNDDAADQVELDAWVAEQDRIHNEELEAQAFFDNVAVERIIRELGE